MATQASGYWCWDSVPDMTNKTPGSGDPFGGGMGGGMRGGAEGVRGVVVFDSKELRDGSPGDSDGCHTPHCGSPGLTSPPTALIQFGPIMVSIHNMGRHMAPLACQRGSDFKGYLMQTLGKCMWLSFRGDPWPTLHGFAYLL